MRSYPNESRYIRFRNLFRWVALLLICLQVFHKCVTASFRIHSHCWPWPDTVPGSRGTLLNLTQTLPTAYTPAGRIDTKQAWCLCNKDSACNAEATGSIPRSGRSPGEGNGNPVQYSCLENPMDRGAWWATVCRVADSQTRLKQLSTHSRGTGMSVEVEK